jgi:Cysteine-rich CPCC
MSSDYPCPGCGFLVFSEPPGSFAICPVCHWEDCDVQFSDPYYDGGPNGTSLVDHQHHLVERFPLSVGEYAGYRRDPHWRPVVLEQ